MDLSNKRCVKIPEELTTAQEVPHVLNFPLLRLLAIHTNAKVSVQYLEGTIQLKRVVSAIPLMNDPEGTLRRRRVANRVIVCVHSVFIHNPQQLEELRDFVMGGEDVPVRL